MATVGSNSLKFDDATKGQRREKVTEELPTIPYGTMLKYLASGGLACFYAWYLLILIGIIPECPANFSLFDQMHMQAGFLVALIAVTALLITSRGFKILNAWLLRPGLTVTMTLFACLFPVFIYFITPQVPNQLIPGIMIFLAGAVTPLFFSSWEVICRRIQPDNPIGFIGFATCAGATMFILVELFFKGSLVEMTIMFALIAGGILLLFRTDSQISESEHFDAKRVKRFIKSSVRISSLFFVLGIGFGLAWSFFMWQDNIIYVYLSLGTGILVAVGLFAYSHWKQKPFIEINTFQRICIATLASAFVVVASGNHEALAVGFCIVIVVWFLFRAFNSGMLMQYSIDNELPIIYFQAIGKLGGIVGILIGWLLGLAFLQSKLTAESLGPITAFYALVAIVAGFGLLSFKSHTAPVDEGARYAESHELEDTQQGGGVDLSEHCNALADLFVLSPRESEVMIYLARGRNATHIAKALTISAHTAKAHTYHIYQKMGVHSQQELIDLIEDYVKQNA